MNLELKVVELGKTSYEEAWKIQKEMLERRERGLIPDTLILTEHEPTITFGLDKKWNSLKVPKEELSKRGITFYEETRRGGGAAYLGPGQLIGYTIINIKPLGGILRFMQMLEEVMIKTAGDFGVTVSRYDVKNPTTDKPYRATWYRNGRDYVLCTKGIGVEMKENGMYTHHGFSLNVNPNKSYLDLIDPCGFPTSEIEPISLAEAISKQNHYKQISIVDLKEVRKSIIKNFLEVFKKESPTEVQQHA